jgi:UDP:flavonoid glycosyltransferase YjiC (YdhE family)
MRVLLTSRPLWSHLVPMVVLLLHAEQPGNAQRLFGLGEGVAVRPERSNA